MHNHNSNNNQPVNNLHTNYKEVLKRVMTDFETDRRINADKYFDVYRFVGDQLNYSDNAVRKFFNKFDNTGVKLGADDLLKMCFLFKNDLPINALLNDYKLLSGEKQEAAIPTNLTANIMNAVKEVGDIAGLFSKAMIDNELTVNEKKALLKEVIEAEQKIAIIKKQLLK